jgi:DNA-binding NarL/FixJ family response regulator
MLSAYKYNHYVITSIQAGVDGYLLKNTPRSELIDAIRMIHSGKGVFNLEAISKVLRKLTSGADSAKSDHNELRKRELEVLKLAASGMSNKQISSELNITDNTVGTHLVSVFRKLGVESRTEAALYALKEGLISINDIASKEET